VKKTQKMKDSHIKKVATISLLAILMLSITTINISPRSTEATILAYLCNNFRASCEEEKIASLSEPSPSRKFLLAPFLQYLNEDGQVHIYKPNMDSEDITSLHVENDDELNPEYVQAALSLPGPASVSFKSSNEIVENAKRVKDLGFNSIEFNLESGLSPDSDNSNVIEAMKKAAQAAHAQGLEFRATPSKEYTTQFGPEIAPYVDYYHIQAQSVQDDGINAYSDYVHITIAKLKQANPNLKISVQVSTQQGNAPGLSKLDTLKQCTDSVMDVADGVYIWFGDEDLRVLKSFVEWYNDKWS
jgi:hypothetical protein